MDLQEITTKFFNSMADAIKGRQSETVLAPAAAIFKDGQIAVIDTTPLAVTGPHWMEILSGIICAIHQKDHIDAYCVAMNTWGVFHPDQELIAKVDSGEIKSYQDLPNREEVLIITAGDAERTLVRIWKVKKAPSGIDIFNEEDIPSDADFTGSFYDLIVERPRYLN